MEIALAILTLLTIVLPVLVKAHYGKKLEGEKARRILIDRDVARLRDDLSKLRARHPPPDVPQG